MASEVFKVGQINMKDPVPAYANNTFKMLNSFFHKLYFWLIARIPLLVWTMTLAHFKLSVEVSSDWGETLSSFFWTDIREQICLFDPYSFESKIFMILKCIFFFRNRYQKTKIKTSKTWRRLIKFGPWSWFSHGTNRSWKTVL